MAWLIQLRENMAIGEVFSGDFALASQLSSLASRNAETETATACPEDAVPKVRRLKRDTGKRIPTFVGTSAPWGQYGVHERVRDLIESVEPGVHQFIEFSLEQPAGRTVPARYFHMNVMNVFDAMIVDRSSTYWEWHDGSRSNDYRKVLVLNRYEKPEHFVMSSRKIASRHLWRGALMMRNSIFVSDILWKKFQDEKLSVFFYRTPVEEIDEDWDREDNVGEYLRFRESEREIYRSKNIHHILPVANSWDRSHG